MEFNFYIIYKTITKWANISSGFRAFDQLEASLHKGEKPRPDQFQSQAMSMRTNQRPYLKEYKQVCDVLDSSAPWVDGQLQPELWFYPCLKKHQWKDKLNWLSVQTRRPMDDEWQKKTFVVANSKLSCHHNSENSLSLFFVETLMRKIERRDHLTASIQVSRSSDLTKWKYLKK